MKGKEHQMQSKSTKKGFTLIELLVVVSIIALLAAILMPSLTGARKAAQQAACIANMHSVGLTLLSYESSNNTFFPTDYSYLNGTSGGAGYQHWTATINPQFYTAATNYYVTATTPDMAVGYPTASPEYVCPSHIAQGFCPTDFTSVRIPQPSPGQTTSNNFDDMQAPRLSYLPNEAIMPRKKYSPTQDALKVNGGDTSALQLVSQDSIDHTNTTILLAEWCQSIVDTEGTSSGGGQAFKTHRPTNAVRTSTGGTFNGETYTTDGTAGFIQLTIADATGDFASSLANSLMSGGNPSGQDALDHIVYSNPNAHVTGSNYLFCDGHAAKYALGDTLNPSNYLWGTHMWSCGSNGTCTNNEIQPNPGNL
jgi:prepilin-type N-terminal cleavage/methylation domain-containing protein/prepilin-type processing-associated H-X9-DG protein